jgi:hypothetical protein
MHLQIILGLCIALLGVLGVQTAMAIGATKGARFGGLALYTAAVLLVGFVMGLMTR